MDDYYFIKHPIITTAQQRWVLLYCGNDGVLDKWQEPTLSDKRPAQRKAAGVYAHIRLEDN